MRLAATLMLLALVFGGASAAGHVRDQSVLPRIGILAIGDFGEGGTPERVFGAAMRRFEARYQAELLLTLGDNDYTKNPTAFRTNWAASYGWLRRAGVTPTGTLGNHDVEVGNGDYELGALGMPAHYYTRVVGDIEFFMLDSNDVTTAQTQWLERELVSSRARWRIAVFHHPPYSCGKHMGEEDVARRWVPLFERYHVQLVLTAHEHSYQRFAPQNGVLYVVDGGGGQVLYRPRSCPASYPRRMRSRVSYGFVYLVFKDDRLDGYAVRFSRQRIDHFIVNP